MKTSAVKLAFLIDKTCFGHNICLPLKKGFRFGKMALLLNDEKFWNVKLSTIQL